MQARGRYSTAFWMPSRPAALWKLYSLPTRYMRREVLSGGSICDVQFCVASLGLAGWLIGPMSVSMGLPVRYSCGVQSILLFRAAYMEAIRC